MLWAGLLGCSRKSSQLYVPRSPLSAGFIAVSQFLASFHSSVYPTSGFQAGMQSTIDTLVTHLSPQEHHVSSAAFLSIRANDLAAGNPLPPSILHQRHSRIYSLPLRRIVTASGSANDIHSDFVASFSECLRPASWVLHGGNIRHCRFPSSRHTYPQGFPQARAAYAGQSIQ